MLLMYSILNWSSGLASGTGGIKVLIADTIVWKAKLLRKKEQKMYASVNTEQEMIWFKALINMKGTTGKENSPLWHPSRFSEYLEFSVSFLCSVERRVVWASGESNINTRQHTTNITYNKLYSCNDLGVFTRHWLIPECKKRKWHWIWSLV